jgi:hypothetical protein
LEDLEDVEDDCKNPRVEIGYMQAMWSKNGWQRLKNMDGKFVKHASHAMV